MRAMRPGCLERKAKGVIPVISAFKWLPDGGMGLAREMRVRWALEEAGQA